MDAHNNTSAIEDIIFPCDLSQMSTNLWTPENLTIPLSPAFTSSSNYISDVIGGEENRKWVEKNNNVQTRLSDHHERPFSPATYNSSSPRSFSPIIGPSLNRIEPKNLVQIPQMMMNSSPIAGYGPQTMMNPFATTNSNFASQSKHISNANYEVDPLTFSRQSLNPFDYNLNSKRKGQEFTRSSFPDNIIEPSLSKKKFCVKRTDGEGLNKDKIVSGYQMEGLNHLSNKYLLPNSVDARETNMINNDTTLDHKLLSMLQGPSYNCPLTMTKSTDNHSNLNSRSGVPNQGSQFSIEGRNAPITSILNQAGLFNSGSSSEMGKGGPKKNKKQRKSGTGEIIMSPEGLDGELLALDEMQDVYKPGSISTTLMKPSDGNQHHVDPLDWFDEEDFVSFYSGIKP